MLRYEIAEVSHTFPLRLTFNNMNRSWKDLPVETLYSIIKFVPYGLYRNTVLQCALVCQSWNNAMNHRLYTNVALRSIASLSKFSRSIIENVNLAIIVNRLHTLLSNLPNLQHLTCLESSSFVSVTDALLDSKLGRLITLRETDKFKCSNDYVTCILHMKDRLRDVILVGEGVPYSRLYDRLHQFEKLELVTVKRVFKSPVEEIDLIVERCRSLRKLEVHIEEKVPADGVDESNTLVLSSPRLAVHSLEIKRIDGEVHQSLLDYIMHKFPNLTDFALKVNRVKVTEVMTFRRLIYYLSKVRTLSLDTITANAEWICKGVGSYWEQVRLQQPDTLIRLAIMVNRVETGVATLELHKDKDDLYTAVDINYSQILNLLANYGNNLQGIEIGGLSRKSVIEGNSHEEFEVIVKLAASGFMFCRQLSKVFLCECDLRHTEENQVIKKAYLQDIRFMSCSIGDRAINTLFGGLSHINKLSFQMCDYYNERNQETQSICINIPNTIINTISIEEYSNYSHKAAHVFVSISTIAKNSPHRVKYYYRCKLDKVVELKVDNEVEVSNEVEFNDERYLQYYHVDITCQSYNSFYMSQDRKFISIPAAMLS